MDEDRKLILGSTWALEEEGTLIVTGPFGRDDELHIARILANFVREQPAPDPFEIPQVTFPSKLATIKPNVNAPTTAPLPKRSQPLVETDEPEQIAPDGSFYEDWLPSRADLYPITHESFCLVPSVAIASHTTITPITVGNENGLRILARDKHNIRQATEILESLGVCWDAIAEPQRRLIIHAPGRENSIFRIIPYSSISSVASWRFLADPAFSHLLASLKTLVVCYFDPIAKTCNPLRNIRDPPKLQKKMGAVTSQHWKTIKLPAIGKSDGYDPPDIDKHVATKPVAEDKKAHPFLSPAKAKDVDAWISKDVKMEDIKNDALQGQPTKEKHPASLSATPAQLHALHNKENIRWQSGMKDGNKPRVAVLPGGGLVKPRGKSSPPPTVRPKLQSQASKSPVPRGSQANIMDTATECNVEPLPSETEKLIANIKGLFPAPTSSAADSPSIETLPGEAKTTATAHPPVGVLIEFDSPTDVQDDHPLAEFSIQDDNPQSGTSFQENNPPSDQRRYPKAYIENLRQSLPAATKENFQNQNSSERDYWCNRPESRPNYWQRSAASHGRHPPEGIPDVSSGVSGTYRRRDNNPKSAIGSRPATPIHRPPNWMIFQIQSILDQNSHPGSIAGPRVPPHSPSRAQRGNTTTQSPAQHDTSPGKRHREAMMKYLQETIEKEQVPRAPALLIPEEPVTPQKPKDELKYLQETIEKEQVPRAPALLIPEEPVTPQNPTNEPFLHPDLIELSPESLVSGSPSRVCEPGEVSGAEISEKVDSTEETQTREFHETMFHQRPANQGLDGAGQENRPKESPKPQNSRDDASGPPLPALHKLDAHLIAQQQKATLPSNPNALPPIEKAALAASTKNLVSSLWPILVQLRTFPGPLTLELQLGLLSILNLTASMQGKEMTFRDVQGLFFSRHDLEPPRTLFASRLTSTPSDIDHLIALKIDGKPVFEQAVSQRGIRYILQCRTSSGQEFFISIDHTGATKTRYGRVELGSVSISFPDRVWDASAMIQGYTHFFPDRVEGLQEAVEKLAESLWLVPTPERLQMLLRAPAKGIMTLEGIVVERRTNHKWISGKSKDVYLRVTESQVLTIVPSVLDPNILVAMGDPHADMVKKGKYWWQASIVNPVIESVLQKTYEPKPNVKPGTPTKSWNAIDLLGLEAHTFYPDVKISPLGARIGSSGIPAMFRLARILVQNIDAVGFYNKGPTAYLKRKTGTLSESKPSTVHPSRDLKKVAVAKWTPTPGHERKKYKW
ncbi:unnamed protein product [Penicillium bialowiezense]